MSNINLTNDILIKIWEIQSAFVNERNHCMTTDEILEFLIKIMNHNKFQMIITLYKLQGVELSFFEKLKMIFDKFSINDFLAFYDIENSQDSLKRIISYDEE